jgi:hypothetical protein
MNVFDMETPMNVRHRRLLALANFLDDLPHSKFHIPAWTAPDCTKTSCGTAGCVGGWAATKFQKLGWGIALSLYPNREGGSIYLRRSCEEDRLWGPLAFGVFFGIPTLFANAITLGFMDRFAGFSLYQEEYDLDKANDVTPQMAADRIRKVLKMVAPQVLEEDVSHEMRELQAVAC